MPNMTMALPPELHKQMKKHPEIKWTQVAREALERKVALLETEKDPWRLYTYKRLIEEGEDAEKLFKF